MCEWLSYGEWCDVKLLCGGRAFNAHRVVLASVSTFLRRILLSCPNDETPTFIILPDFDLDAMSSVLYYIYNGEVIIQKQKLELFLDIIRAMQIFVDSQHFPISSDFDISNQNYAYKNDSEISEINIFTLGSEDSKCQPYIKIKKHNEDQDLQMQYSESNFDGTDKTRESALGDLKSLYADRQRNSFVRDLFIETYPRNSNVNGLTAGVLAMSNECYRAPSVLLTNANGKHLNDTVLESHKKTSENIRNSPSVFHILQEQRITRGEQDYGETSKSFYNSFSNMCSLGKFNSRYVFDIESTKSEGNEWNNRIPISENSLLQIGVQKQFLSGLYVPSDYSVPPLLFDSVNSMTAYRKVTSTSNGSIISCDNVDKVINTSATHKVAILNHVLDSPWSPRRTINYKPYRRKVDNNLHYHQNDIKNNIVSDNNNNLEVSPGMVNLSCKDSVKSVIDQINLAATELSRSRKHIFKCATCSQVFTSNELLSVHMRRHTTIARYTCCECTKTFSQLRNFKYHMSIHRGTREFAATCSVCGKYFNDRGYLSSHMKIHRNRKEYKCTVCPKSFNQRVAYNMHVRIHTGIKPHVCEQCGKAFARKMLLKQHQRTHSGERPYACPHCDKRFADRSNMTLHLRLHTGVKPFSCTLCPKSFTKKHHLKSHLNFHTGSKPYSCPRCKLAFTQSSNMRTHLKKCRAPEPDPETGSTS